MTKHEAAREIVEHDGDCGVIDCDDCPATMGPDGQGLCVDHWHKNRQGYDGRKASVQWFKAWLASHPEEPSK